MSNKESIMMGRLSTVAFVLAVALTASMASADTYTWTVTGSAANLTWSTTANWTVDGSPSGSGWPMVAGDTADLRVNITGPQP
jgi:hypothetical protein